MPSIADLETSKIGFAFKDGMKCKDSLKLLDVQVEESCGKSYFIFHNAL